MSLNAAVKKQIALLTQLKTFLDNELQLITARDAEALLKLVEEKQQVLETIQQQDAVVAEFYEAETTVTEPTQALLEQAKQLLEDCKFSTNVNAKAVEQGQLKLEHLRKLLIEVRNKESLTYDKAGRAQGGGMLGSIKA